MKEHDHAIMTLAASIPSADWITAWATVGAAAGTAFTLIVAVLTLRLQVTASLRQQAARIVVDAELRQNAVSLVVRNMSDLPVTDLHGRVYFKRDAATKDIGGFRFFSTKWNGLMPERYQIAPGGETRIPLPALPDHVSIGARVMFRDSSGLTWSRQWPSGELRLRERGPRRTAIFRAFLIAIFLSVAISSLASMLRAGPDFGNIAGLISGLLGGINLAVLTRTMPLGFRKPIYELGWNQPDQGRHRTVADPNPTDETSDSEGERPE